MVIIAKGDDRFEIKTKAATILTGQTTSINNVELAGPGEYEIGDCKVTGFPPSIYLIEAEGVTIAYLDRLSAMLSDHEIEQLSEPDILITPTGGEHTLDPKSSQRLVTLVDPKLVIPMLGDAGAFAKLLGVSVEQVAQLKVTAQSLPQDGRRVVILKP